MGLPFDPPLRMLGLYLFHFCQTLIITAPMSRAKWREVRKSFKKQWGSLHPFETITPLIGKFTSLSFWCLLPEDPYLAL